MDSKMCRICMAKENLSSVFTVFDGERIFEKIIYVCGQIVTSSDALPKHICHSCLSSISIAATIKRKSIATEKILTEMLSEEVEFIDEKDPNEDDPFLVETERSRFLVYEENSDNTNQPKMDYNLSETSVRIHNTNHFNYNPELKAFVENYLEHMPNLDIIKISDPGCIREIEKVLVINEDYKPAVKREKLENSGVQIGRQVTRPKTTFSQPTTSRLLNALSGQRQGNFVKQNPNVSIVSRKIN